MKSTHPFYSISIPNTSYNFFLQKLFPVGSVKRFFDERKNLIIFVLEIPKVKLENVNKTILEKPKVVKSQKVSGFFRFF